MFPLQPMPWIDADAIRRESDIASIWDGVKQ